MPFASLVDGVRRAWSWTTDTAGHAKRWATEFWTQVQPTREARTGWIRALFALVVAWGAYFGYEARFGFSIAGDAAIGIVIASFIFFAGGGALWLALHVLRWLTRVVPFWPLAVFGAVALLMNDEWMSPYAAWITAALVATFGATLASLFKREMPRARRVVTIVLLTFSTAALGATAWLFTWRGYEKEMADAPLSKQPKVAALNAEDPSQNGPYRYTTFTYTPGTDKHRDEYGPHAKDAVKSRTVDASKIFKGPEGWRAKLYKFYWGFDMKRLPLNARVWLPGGAGPFPLIVCVHGNHLAQDFSDPGYGYLGEFLASRGYIFVSVDENFINSSWTDGLQQKETAARGWLLLEHLKLFREWNATKGHRFEGKVDLDRIAVMGHSRGGEAAATAVALNTLPAWPGDATLRFDYNFHIRSVLAIAPADGQYKPSGIDRPLKDVNYFVIHGGYDGDVSAFAGSRQYNRVAFSPGSECFKSELWIYRANHGQFNTVWGDDDNGAPNGWIANLRPLLDANVQRKIARVYFAAFFDATLRDKAEYRELFRDYRVGARWLPDTTYVNRYADARRVTVANFDEDLNVESATLEGARIRGDKLAVWKQQRVNLRWGDRGDVGVYLGWHEPAAAYTVELPAELVAKLSADSRLVFDLSDANEKPPAPDEGKKDASKKDAKKKDKAAKNDKKDDDKKPKPALDFDVELVLANGNVARLPLSAIGPIYRPFHVEYQKLTWFGFARDDKDTEPVLGRYAVALKSFVGVNPAEVRAVRFHFDRSKEGVVIVDNIAFEGVAASPVAKP